MHRIAAALLCCLLPVSLSAQGDAGRDLEREIFRQLIEINTSDSAGRTLEASEALARRLLDAGLPAADVRILRPDDRQGMLVARYRGTGAGGRPILLMAHLDVVDARPEDWTVPPYRFLELDGYYYGRGTSDNKAGAAMLVANFIRYRREGFVPSRDLILLLTSDEETEQVSIDWVLREHRDLVDAEFALNTDGGGGELLNGQPVTFSIQASEKVYQTFTFTVRNRGGHSSVPEPDNAIYRLTAGLARLASHQFPVQLNEVTRAYFDRSAAGQPGDIARDMRALVTAGDPAAAARLSRVPFYNSVLRTTCVATRLYGGHADNALPQLAQATVNCRILPGVPVAMVETVLREVVADSAIEISRVNEARPSPPSPLRPDVMRPLERLVAETWPRAVVIPEMSTGATDGLYTRNAGIPTYGVSGIFDEVGDIRAHGRDERVGVEAFHRAARFWYALVRALAGGPGGA